MFIGIGVAIAARAIGNVRAMRYRGLPPQQHQAPMMLEDPRVGHLQAEVEELRTQVERLSAAENFYAQLNAGGTPSSAGAAMAQPAARMPGAETPAPRSGD